MAFTGVQLGRLAADAGFRGDDILVAAAVALAESGGDPGAVGDGGDSIGLWQINRPAHPTIGTVAELKDPAYNARAAHQVWTAEGWRAWTQYRNGRYRPHYDKLRSDVRNLDTGEGGLIDWSSVPVVGPVVGGVEAVGDAVNAGVDGLAETMGATVQALNALREWVSDSHNWTRVALVVGGVALALVGAAAVARPATESVVKPVVKAVA
jgi:hypothetical protein